MTSLAYSTNSLSRERLIDELLIRAHAWRQQEVTHTTEQNEIAAGRCKARAEVLEGFARDLEDRSLLVGEHGR